jgi:hypothetical protein
VEPDPTPSERLAERERTTILAILATRGRQLLARLDLPKPSRV